MTDFTMTKDADRVAVITWDVPGKSMNVLSLDGMAELDALIDEAHADDAVKGIVITSGKPDFAGGMDLNVIAEMKNSAGENPARGLFDGIMRFHAFERKIELASMDPKTKKAANPRPPPCPAQRLGSAWKSRWRVTAALLPTTPKPRSACLKSRSASSPEPVVQPAWCG